jgi:hypothetical protein
MDVGLLFWMLMILWGITLIGAAYGAHWAWIAGSSVLQWILFACLGWKIFGPIIR